MIIAPLLFATLVIGISGHGNIKDLGKIGIKTIVYFEIVTTIALIIGLAAGHFFKPGNGLIFSFFNTVIALQLTLITNVSLVTEPPIIGPP